MTKYKRHTVVDGKLGWIVVDDDGIIINKCPSKDELKGLQTEKHKRNDRNKKYIDKELLNYLKDFYQENKRVPMTYDFNNNPEYPGFRTYYRYFGDWSNALEHAGLADVIYNETNTCDRCREQGKITKLDSHNARKELDEKGDWTGRWDCQNCWRKYDPNSQNNIMKSLADRRTGNLNPTSSHSKGDKFQKLINTLRNLVDLNESNDNYSSLIDSIDPITKLKYQIKGKLYDPIERRWNFTSLESEWDKEFSYMICCCASEDGKIIERIYEIPKEEIIGRKSIGIVKNPKRIRKGELWYEQYRVIDEEEIRRANEIWRRINEEM